MNESGISNSLHLFFNGCKQLFTTQICFGKSKKVHVGLLIRFQRQGAWVRKVKSKMSELSNLRCWNCQMWEIAQKLENFLDFSCKIKSRTTPKWRSWKVCLLTKCWEMGKIKFYGGHMFTGTQLYVYQYTASMSQNATPFKAFIGTILIDFPEYAEQQVPFPQ